MALSIDGTNGISGVDGSNASPAIQGSDSNTGFSFGTDTVNINTGGVTRATIDSAGALDVPSAFPIKVAGTQKFEISSTQIKADTNIFIEKAGTDQTFLTLNSDLGTNNNRELLFKSPNTDSVDEPFRIDTGNALAFFTDGQESFRIRFNRNVGFGTTSPDERVHIGDNDKIRFKRAVVNTDGSNIPDAAIKVNILSSSAGSIHSRAGNNANRRHFRFYNNNGNVGEIRTQNNGTTFSTSSDYRLKENAVAIDDGITRLKTLKPYKFNFKSNPSLTVDGFFAHEATQIPEAVGGTKDEVVTQAMVDTGDYPESELGNPIYQSIDHSRFVPLLTAALQDAISKIEVLETKVAALEAG